MITPVGLNTDESWKALINGKSGIGPITQFEDKSMPTQIAGEIHGFDSLAYIDTKEIKKMDRFIHFAIAASQMAMNESGLTITPENAEHVGILVSSGMGGLPAIEKYHKIYLSSGYRKISPFFIPMLIVNMASGQLSIRYGAKGPNSCIVTACATGTHSIGDAFKIIQRGDALAMIAGGTESCICPLGVGGFNAMKALSTRNSEPQRASRPFDAERDGFVMGEGAGVVILEDMEYALKRGAKICAEVVGYGM